MDKIQVDIDIIRAELKFLKIKYEHALLDQDLRKLKGLSIWINKLEQKLAKAQLKGQQSTLDYVREYKRRREVNSEW